MSVSKGAINTGAYRNVFSEFGYSQESIDRKVADCWKNLFYGDDNTRFYYPVDGERAFIMDTGNTDARTEGMSYGMMMCVQMDKKDEFDRIWKWAYDYMLHKEEGPCKGYFAWSCDLDGKHNWDASAPDGEEYFAMALFFASHRWGDGEAPFDYSAQARSILRECIHKGEPGHPGDPMWNRENKLIKFGPEWDFTDPSYHLPHFYELFGLWADEQDRDFWKQAAAASREYLHVAIHPETGLSPEYSLYNGEPETTRNHPYFYSDAYRTIENIGLDAAWFGTDAWSKTGEANKHLKFFVKNGLELEDFRIYSIDGKGTPLDEPAKHPYGLLATIAMGSLAASGAEVKKVIDAFWNLPLRHGKYRYYDNCLYFFAVLALSGNYRIW